MLACNSMLKVCYTNSWLYKHFTLQSFKKLIYIYFYIFFNNQVSFVGSMVIPAFATADTFPDPQWIRGTGDSTEPYKHYVFSCAYKLNLHVRYNKRLTTPINDKIGQLQHYTLAQVRWMWSVSQNLLLSHTPPSGDDVRWQPAGRVEVGEVLLSTAAVTWTQSGHLSGNRGGSHVTRSGRCGDVGQRRDSDSYFWTTAESKPAEKDWNELG